MPHSLKTLTYLGKVRGKALLTSNLILSKSTFRTSFPDWKCCDTDLDEQERIDCVFWRDKMHLGSQWLSCVEGFRCFLKSCKYNIFNCQQKFHYLFGKFRFFNLKIDKFKVTNDILNKHMNTTTNLLSDTLEEFLYGRNKPNRKNYSLHACFVSSNKRYIEYSTIPDTVLHWLLVSWQISSGIYGVTKTWNV